MAKRCFLAIAKHSIVTLVFRVIEYVDISASNLREVYERIDIMLDQMKAIILQKDPTLPFYNNHI